MSNRLIYFLSSLFAFGLIVVAVLIQVYDHLEPCPLCIFQRIAFGAFGSIALLATLINPNPREWVAMSFNIVLMITAIAGMGIAGRHVWLQMLPPEAVPSCGPGWEIMVNEFPLSELIKTTLQGSGDCAHVSWTLFGLSMPIWSFICFSLLLDACIFLMIRHKIRFSNT